MNIFIYLAFLLFYIVCFYFMYVKNTELISLTILTVLGAVFLAYNVDGVNQFFHEGGVNKNLYISMLSLFASCSGLFIEFIGLCLIVMTTIYIQYSYQTKNGDALHLPLMYKNLLNDFKKYYIIIFLLSYLILFVFLYKSSVIQQRGFSLELTLCILAMSAIILGGSYYIMIFANEYAKLRQKDFMDIPVAGGKPIDDANVSSPQETPLNLAATFAESSLLQIPTPASNNVVRTNKPAMATAAMAATATTIATPSPTINAYSSNAYDVSRVLLTEPTLSYSDFCTLGTQDYDGLISGSNLSFGNKALFTRFRNACPDKNKSTQLFSAASNSISAASSIVDQGKGAAGNIRQNANPSNVQNDYISQNMPGVV